jgi:hypothetical protein
MSEHGRSKPVLEESVKRGSIARIAIAVVTASAGLGGSHVVSAQEAGGLMIDVAECITLESAVDRFQCYESRANAALEGRDGAPVGAARRAEPSGASAFESAGRAAGGAPEEAIERGAPRAAAARSQSQDETPSEFYGTVAAVRETVPNTYVITLENGQVWRQTRPNRYPLQVGYRVRIYESGWGSSYRMSSEELRGFIQVERVR